MNYPLRTSFLKFVQSSLFASADGLLPVYFGVPFACSSSLLFPSSFEFRCGEPVGEGKGGRPFPVPFFVGTCLNELSKRTLAFRGPKYAVTSLRVVNGISFAFSVRFSTCCRSVLVSISRFEMRIFVLEMSLGH